MKNLIAVLIIGVTLFFSPRLFAQDKSFSDGSVWQIGFIKTEANMQTDYLNSLKSNWKATHDEAVRQGLILSYKILSGSSANPDDWDIMLMTEYKSLAAMEATEDKWEAISKKVIGGEDAMKKLNEVRVSMRTIYGGKMLREVVYK